MNERQPRRVLMTADAVGGVWSYALTLIEQLAGRADVLLAVMGPAPSAAQRAAASRIPNLRLAESDLRLEWMLEADRDLAQAGAWLRELAAEFRPDLVHVNGYAAAGERWTIPVLVVAHSCVLSWWRAVHGCAAPPAWDAYAGRVARGLAHADCIVAPTRAMLRALALDYGRPCSGRVIANGCVLEHFGSASKEKLVLGAGRLWDEAKNLAALDNAANGAAWPVFVAGECRHPDGHVVLPVNAVALGKLEPEALAGWMARAAVYALPARYEPFGLSVLEAAASGCALVLGNIPSLRELWDEAALFVSPEDSSALAEAIEQLMGNDALRHDLAAAARRRARRYKASVMADRYAALYDELAAACGPAIRAFAAAE